MWPWQRFTIEYSWWIWRLYWLECCHHCNHSMRWLGSISAFPGGLVVRIRRSHRRGRGSIPRLGIPFFPSIHFPYWEIIFCRKSCWPVCMSLNSSWACCCVWKFSFPQWKGNKSALQATNSFERKRLGFPSSGEDASLAAQAKSAPASCRLSLGKRVAFQQQNWVRIHWISFAIWLL